MKPSTDLQNELSKKIKNMNKQKKMLWSYCRILKEQNQKHWISSDEASKQQTSRNSRCNTTIEELRAELLYNFILGKKKGKQKQYEYTNSDMKALEQLTCSLMSHSGW